MHYWRDHGRWKTLNDRDWRVEQAKGMVATQAAVSIDEAALRLDEYSRANDEPLEAVADQVVGRTLRFGCR